MRTPPLRLPRRDLSEPDLQLGGVDVELDEAIAILLELLQAGRAGKLWL
jgi:hypothetical protein